MAEQSMLFLPSNYLEQVKAILAQHIPEAAVWAYGSRVNGDHYDASDLDLVAHFPDNAARDLFRLSAVREAFSDSNLPIIVQIVDWSRIPQAFRNEIEACYVIVQLPNKLGGLGSDL
jgi:predicted nucleotidyltransferase